MSNEIVPQAFESQEFGTIRALEHDGRPMFCAKDVAAALGYKDTINAIKQHCRGVAFHHPIKDNLGREQNARFITEGDMYRLIASSKLESAQRFESWVFDEVIPSIRRDGAYVASDGSEDDATLMARALKAADRALRERDARMAALEAENAEMRPKALFADSVAASDGTCLVGELAKMMTQAGFPIGQNRLFKLLRDDGFLGKSGSNRNVPLQRYVEMGLFRIKETAITHADGHVTINRTPKVTGKGQRYFIERYCGREVA
jgi:anti-repressor protein